MLARIARVLLIVAGFVARLVCDKRLPAICCHANGSHIAACGAHSGRVGVLARAVDSHP
jgi:hypothetical protein